MFDKIDGLLKVGHTEAGDIVIDYPNPAPKANEDKKSLGPIVFSIVFSADQARGLASSLLKHADAVEHEIRVKREQERYKAAMEIPVDRSARTLHDGSPETPDHLEINPETGMQKAYVVLSAEERAKGFVRPVRRSYVHKTCGTMTTMGTEIAETYARDPKFYGGTFCVSCRAHFPVDQFVWAGTDERVGS